MLIYFIVLSIALSIDALGIGISYRLSGVTIPMKTKIIIGVITSVIMVASLIIGSIIHREVSSGIAKYIGAVVLIIIGVIFICQSLFQKKEAAYDLDHSRCIEPLEGVLLAIALSTDSIGAGIAIASTGISQYWLGIMVGAFQLGFLFLADYFVDHVKAVRKFKQKVCGVLSGFLLVLIGLIRFLC